MALTPEAQASLDKLGKAQDWQASPDCFLMPMWISELSFYAPTPWCKEHSSYDCAVRKP